jgi:hypothetical protein
MYGVVAQMVERMLSMHEAAGSMPAYSSRFCFFTEGKKREDKIEEKEEIE